MLRAGWRLAFVCLVAIAACSPTGGDGKVTLAPDSALPEFARSAPPAVREAYRFALANREVLSSIPCYCGCGGAGHQSNLHCYVKPGAAGAPVEFDTHAFG